MKSTVLLLTCVCVAFPVQAQQHQQPQTPPAGFVLKQITDTLPKADQLEVRVRTVTVPPGSIGEWHTHATPPIVYVLEGTFTVEVKDKGTIETKAGEAAIEPVNTVVRATNKGQTPVKLVVFQVSPPEVPFSHPAAQ